MATDAISPISGVANSLTYGDPNQGAFPPGPLPQSAGFGGNGLPPGFELEQSGAALPPGFELEAPNAPSIPEGMVRAAGTGVPLVGGLLNKAEAGTNAALSYALNPLFSKDQQLTGSLADRYRQSLDIQNQMDTAFQQQHPVLNAGSEMAGGVASMLPLAGTGVGARLLGLVGSLPRQMAAASASSAAIGAADAYLRGGDPMQGAAEGAAFGAAGPVAGRVVGKVAGAFAPNARNYAPSQEAIENIADQQYESARNSNVMFQGSHTVMQPTPSGAMPVTLPSAAQVLGQQSAQRLMQEGFRPSDSPAVFDIVQKEMIPPAGTPTSFSDMMAVYRQLNKRIAMTNNPMERGMATMVKQDVSNFLSNPPEGAVLSGDAQQAAADFRAANANYSSARGSQTILDKVDQALNQAGGSYSGLNVENSIRQKIKGILNNPKMARGFQPEELAAMQDFVRSGAGGVGDYIRTAGNLMQGGGGLGAQMEVYAALLSGNPAGLAVPIAGRAVRMFGNALANRAGENLAAQVRLRAPAAAQAAQRYDYVVQAAHNAARHAGNIGNLGVRSIQPLVTQQQQPSYPAGQ